MLLFRSNSRARPQLLSLLLVFAAFFQFSVLAVPLPIAQLEKRVGIPDSFDPIKIYQWLQRHKPADPSKLVFYTDKDIGKPMAEAFVHHNPGYAYFYDIYGPAFARDMGLVNGKYPTANAIPMSKAMGLWATGDTRVFNSPKAKPEAFWIKHELPQLKEQSKVKHIWAMRDNTLHPNDFGLDLKH